MAFAADRFLRLNVATPTRRVVSLPSSCVDLQNVGPTLLSRDFYSLVAFFARSLLEVRSVSKIVQTERCSKRGAVLHAFRLLHVTGAASGQLITGLMNMTRVAIGMFRHASPQTLIVESMTEVTSWNCFRHLLRIHLPPHLLRVCMVTMRKTLKTELHQTRGETDSGSLSINWRLVAHDAHFTFLVCEVLRVTFDAGRMSREDWGGIVGGAQMANGAILGFRLVFFAVVIERQDDFDDLRANDVKRRLAHRRWGRGRAFGRLVQVLLRAAASPEADNERDHQRHSLQVVCGLACHLISNAAKKHIPAVILIVGQVRLELRRSSMFVANR